MVFNKIKIEFSKSVHIYIIKLIKQHNTRFNNLGSR
jgi:hypothetical protein